ncbi:MAG: galactose-1-phosphate uridylyltransferase [Candidatus Schekmanbacteria bacterium RBG_13_48_7]|uniref:Galactose-1-phosphate uridylyltransferase n=1 Tax=Candidatus Schekmanbacteria bacterium RBG_13_48_7 TaxID=1817878 RepID=A0A1F7RNZ8_9BACT|nr:MAG: galactose-1-phosphate uridylyltransferase [Candidatus Schekmanbacteria bacterium RBG_13_48_7]
MSELRKDPIIGRWVIISPDRGKRPTDYGTEPENTISGFCPFDEGNESKTPSEIYAIRHSDSKSNSSGWKLRVVPNKFPVLRIEGDLERQGLGLFDQMNGIGAHEVIIETTNHKHTIADLTLEDVVRILESYRARILDLKNDKRFRFTMVFKNYKHAAGASLEHPHSQLITMPIVPKRVWEELEGSKTYYNFKERCIYCDIIRQEIGQNVRVISENDRFINISPYASRFPFETWLLPKQHMSNFENIRHEDLFSLGEMLKDILMRIQKVLKDPPYNYLVHTAPFDFKNPEQYHWHFEIIPKLTRVAGFEWGTGFYINPTLPEDATRYLREAEI